MRIILISFAFILLTAGRVMAHASEQGFVLLLPTDIYITGGTLTVIATIVLVVFLSPQALARFFRPRDVVTLPQVVTPLMISNIVASALFATLIYIGLFGPTDPQKNLLPLSVWTVFWVGVFVVQGLCFDIWRWLNPWAGLHKTLLGRSPPIYQLPKELGAWPAVVIFIMFQIFAVADIAPSDPVRLAKVAAGYWCFTFLGMVVFGRGAWLAQVECFSVLFDLIGRLRTLRGPRDLRFAGPGWAALRPLPPHPSLAVFALLILGAGSFDGLHETFWWLGKIGINPLAFPGRSAVIVTSTVGLLVANAVLVAVFAGAVWIGLRLCGHVDLRISDAVFALAMSILPIAFGYHVAHFLVSFLVQIQYAMLALGDPFGAGWNLGRLGDTSVTTGFLKAPASVRIVWLAQAGVVVASHVLAVLMSHHIASVLVKGRAQVISLQIGLSVLMIAYTVFGLWLLATPRGM